MLKEDNILDETNPNCVQFSNILESARENKVTKTDRESLICKCSMCRMGMSTFQRRISDDVGVSHLFYTNKDTENYNDFQISNSLTVYNQKNSSK